MRTEQLVPLSERAVEPSANQQRLVEQARPSGSPWLFPARSRPQLPLGLRQLPRRVHPLAGTIGLHDEAGRPVHVVLHQLRHSLGTRLINKASPST